MKVFTYVFIISGIMTLLYFGGFTDLPTADLINSILSGGLSNIVTSSLYTKVTAALSFVVVGGSIIAGLFGKSFDFSIIKMGFVGWFLGVFIVDLVWLYNKLSSQGDFYTIIAGLIFVPLIIGFIISAIDWVTGTD